MRIFLGLLSWAAEDIAIFKNTSIKTKKTPKADLIMMGILN
ncbi:MAG: hypothetical protein PHY05_05130 [Methanothrix sp.]|nr:hypothetical protein [Methanothrix sp.]